MDYDAGLSFAYGHTPKTVFEANAIDTTGDLVDELGCKRAFIVTDSYLAEKTDMVSRLEKTLGPRLVGVYSGVEPNPTSTVVDAGSAIAVEKKADILISLGGGSAIDAAKGMAVVAQEGGCLLDHEGYHNLRRPPMKHIAIPTTAGTGSESTMTAVISIPERDGQKTFIGSHFLHPTAAVLDATLVVGLPPKLTAATGMDAMSHSVEALFSSLRNPLSDAYALGAIRMICRHLPTCITRPDDLNARGQMLLAATMAGSAFSTANVSLNHAMAHSLGALFHIHHGTANAMLLPHTMRLFNEAVCDELALVAGAMGVDTTGMSSEQAGLAAADRMKAFVAEVGLPETLKDHGVAQADLARVAEMALTDGAIVYSPVPVFDTEIIEGVLSAAL